MTLPFRILPFLLLLLVCASVCSLDSMKNPNSNEESNFAIAAEVEARLSNWPIFVLDHQSSSSFSSYSSLFDEEPSEDDSMLNPLIIVPGLTSSTLQVKLDGDSPPHWFCRHSTEEWVQLWPLEDINLIGPLADCFVHNFEILFDPSNSSYPYSSNAGVEMRAPFFGSAGPDSNTWIQQILTHLNNFSTFYQPDTTVRGAPYDWRLDGRGSSMNGSHHVDNEGIFESFAHLVEQTSAANGGRRVHLLGHSYGGPVVYNFLANYVSDEWKKRYIASFISLSGPFLGTPVASGALTSMALFSRIPVQNNDVEAPSVGFPGLMNKLFNMFQTFPAVIELMPSEKWSGWNNGSDLFGTTLHPIASTPSKTYWPSDLLELLADANATLPHNIRSAFSDDFNNLPPPGVPTLCLHGYGIPTVATMMYTNETFEAIDSVGWGSGDTAILVDSLSYCSTWIGQQDEPVVYKPMFNVSHNGIINSTESWGYIAQWLVNISSAQSY